MEAASGKRVATVGVASDAGDVFHDAADKRVYVSGGDGGVTVVDQTGPDACRVSGEVRQDRCRGANVVLRARPVHAVRRGAATLRSAS